MTLAIPVAFAGRNPRILARLQERHKRIVEASIDAIAGKRIVDLGSNNGRWTYACLKAGARHVDAVEGRQDRVEVANRILAEHGVRSRHRFHVADMFDWLQDVRPGSVDTVLCLGIFYHIMDHYRLLTLMARTGATTIIVDSGFVRSFRNSVHVQLEDPAAHSNALARYEGQKAELAGFVSLGLMIQMAWNLGFTCRPVVWTPGEIANRDAVHDYLAGLRYTLRLERTGAHADPDWQVYWKRGLCALNPRFGALLDTSTHDSVVDTRVRRPFESMQFSVL